MKLQSKTAIITGAAHGIGKAIAMKFAEEGADVAIFDINLPKAEEVAVAIRSLGRKALVVQCDVGDSQQVAKAFEQTVAVHFRVWWPYPGSNNAMKSHR